MKIANIDELKKQLTQASQNVSVAGQPSKTGTTGYEDKIISEWKAEKIKAVAIPEFDTAKDLIRITLKGLSYATVIEGEGGIGKTFLTVETIKEELKPDEWVYKSGFTSALAFYRYLYQNRNAKIIIADDVEGLFNNPTSLSILKRATYDTTGRRLIFYDTTSEKAEGLPSVFELKARLIILCNRIPNTDEPNVSAFLSRTIHYELEFSHQQKKDIIKHILTQKKDLSKEHKDLVMEIIDKETSVATKDFNIRTMEKLIAYVKYSPQKATDLFKQTTPKDDDEETVLRLMASDWSAEQQANEFFKNTGKSRRTYFRIKKELTKKDCAQKCQSANK